MQKRHEAPIKRVNPSGRTVWVARYTGRDGKRRSAGTYALKRDAQDAINTAYGAAEAALVRKETIGGYAKTWIENHPRSERTNDTNRNRLRQVLDEPIDGVPLRAWHWQDLRRRHAIELVRIMLVKQRRSAAGAVNILRTLSAMTADAIDDELAPDNPWKGVKVRATDPRITKAPRPVRVWTWEQMHGFAAAAQTPAHQAMIRVLSDCGLRLGEMLALYRRDMDDGFLLVRRTTYKGTLSEGTKTDHGEANPGRRVPVPPELWAMLVALPKRIDTPLLFPTLHALVWRETHFYSRVWWPTQKVAGIDPRPHEFRHSYVSLLSAARIDPADLADIAGHTVQTAMQHYRHSLGRSFDDVRRAIG